MTHVAIAEKFGQQFGMRITKQTISGWMKDKDKYLKIEEEDVDGYRIRDAKFPELEDCIALWHNKCMDNNIPVLDEMIKIKARDYYGPLCNIDPNFKFSNGWLQNFEKRFQLTLRTICGESGSVNKETLDRDRELVRRVTSKYKLCDIFNLDETALFYRLPPNKTLASKLSKLEGINQSKDRLTIAFIVNALGTEFVKPIVIAHHRKPRCFKNVWWHKAFCSYFYNKTAWMTMVIFEAWVLEFNEKIKKENRHV